jgi:hypothetical protein
MASFNKKEPYLEDLKKKTLDLVSPHQPMFSMTSPPVVKVGTKTFYGEDRKTVYLLFKINLRILVYSAEFLFQSTGKDTSKPDRLSVLKKVMDDETFREMLVEDDEEYLRELFKFIKIRSTRKKEIFTHKNALWLLDLPKN